MSRQKRRRGLAWFVLFATIVAAIAVAPAANARSRSGSEEREIARCIQRAASGKTWLEKTLWGLRDQEGGWLGAEVLNTNGSHDLGPLQVNSWWVPKLAAVTGRPAAHVRWWLTHDACFNASAARWIFLSGLAVTRDYWTAVGVYHSPTEWRQRRYSQSFARHLRDRFGPDVFVRSISVPRQNEP